MRNARGDAVGKRVCTMRVFGQYWTCSLGRLLPRMRSNPGAFSTSMSRRRRCQPDDKPLVKSVGSGSWNGGAGGRPSIQVEWSGEERMHEYYRGYGAVVWIGMVGLCWVRVGQAAIP